MLRKVVILLTSCGLVITPQKNSSAEDFLQRALRRADLYNWTDTAADFSEAERLFRLAGDKRNALYAGLGKLRANVDQLVLPAVSAELTSELHNNAILREDKHLRMFCLIIKGDIDQEMDNDAMRNDWEEVQMLAREVGDAKWQYRSLAQLGIAAFYGGDVDTASRNVGSALAAATKAGDKGAQIRYTTVLGIALVSSNIYDQSLPYFDQALKLAKAVPDSGYPYLTYRARVQALIGLKQYDAAQHLAADILAQTAAAHRTSQQSATLVMLSEMAAAQKQYRAAESYAEQCIAISEAAGYRQQLSDAQGLLADVYREEGKLANAEEFAARAAANSQASGYIWSVPERLHTLARLQTNQGKYVDADRSYGRAEAFIDSLVGNAPSVLEKTALIRVSSEIYKEHFALVAERFDDPQKAYAIVEQVRGRVTTDLLMAGSLTSEEAKRSEQMISQLRLKLMSAHSDEDVRRIRDQIFTEQESRWVSPGISVLKAQSHETVFLKRVQEILSPSTFMLEYIVTDPRSYCLVISHNSVRIVPLASRQRIEDATSDYLKAVKAKRPARNEARALYLVLLQPIPGINLKEHLIVIRDGQLHLLPFDGFEDANGRYVAESRIVTYVPSATSFYLMAKEKRSHETFSRALLAVGGIPYSADKRLTDGAITRGYEPDGSLADLPGSRDEVLAANTAVHDSTNTLLLGPRATEAAFKHADLANYRIIHLSVHGFANQKNPDQAMLVLLPDNASGEDGFLHASEVVMLRLRADLVVLSACETAVGPVEGQEGIETLSKAFFLAGAKNVVSTLWSIDDTFSLYLMKRFYAHLAAHESPAYALTAAKRDVVRNFRKQAVPYYWAGFTFEGVADRDVIPRSAVN